MLLYVSVRSEANDVPRRLSKSEQGFKMVEEVYKHGLQLSLYSYEQ